MSRRTRPALAAAAAALALTAVPLALAPAADAAATPKRVSAMAALMPPIGTEIPSSVLAPGSTIRIGADVYSVDFRGGIRQRADVDTADPLSSVRLRTVAFRATAELPGDAGTVTLEQSDADVAAQSTLTMTRQFPPRYEERDVIPVAATIERPGEDPVVLQGAQPLVLRNATLTGFPARGDVYTLEAPLNLVDPASPGTVVATLQTFSAQRGGL